MKRGKRVLVLVPPILAGVLIVVLRMRGAATQPVKPDAGAPAGEKPADPPAAPADAPAEKLNGPVKVVVGAYLSHVAEIDMKLNTYLADFYLWFRWKGPVDPSKSWELTNAVQSWDIMKTPVYTNDAGEPEADTLEDGTRYQVFHVQARLQHQFPLKDYPFDEQDLVITVEDAEFSTDTIVYELDKAGTGYHKGIQIPGWFMRDTSPTVGSTTYASNFGDPRVTTGEDNYPRFVFSVRITRPVTGLMIKTILPLAIVILITFVIFFIESKYFEGRLGLAITSLLSAVALQLTASSDLPSTGYMVLLDKIYNVSYLVILLTLLESVIAVRLTDTGREEQAKKLDRITLITLAVVFFGGVTMIILLR